MLNTNLLPRRHRDTEFYSCFSARPRVFVVQKMCNLFLTITNSREFATSCPQGKFVAKDFELRKSYITDFFKLKIGSGDVSAPKLSGS